MSAEAVGYVFRMSPYTGATFACHLAVADSVNDQNGYEFWASASTLGAKARCARETASRCLAQMTDDGYLELLEERPGATNLYRFEFPADAVVRYEPRRRARVAPPSGGCDDTSQVPSGGRDDTSQGCDQGSHPGVTTDRRGCDDRSHKPNRTQEEQPKLNQQHLPGVPDRDADVRAVFEAWVQSTGKNARTVLDKKRGELIRKALDHYPVADVLDAVRGWEHSAYHRGHNGQGRVYNDLGLVLRNAEHIERFRDLARGPRQPDPGPNRGGLIRDRNQTSGRVQL